MSTTGSVMTHHTPPAMPDIPFPAAINPLTRHAQEHTLDWAYRFGLVRGGAAVRRVRRLRLGYLGGRTHPRATFEPLAVATDWLSWRFLLEEQVEELPPAVLAATGRDLPRQMAVALQPGEPFADTAVSRALANLLRRTARLTSSRWQERFAADLIDHLRRLRHDASHRGQRRVPDVESYVATRRHASGVFLALDIVEAAERVEVPTGLAASPEYQALRAATNDVVSWTSDIASSGRGRGSMDNLVVVLQHRQGCSTTAAIRHAAEMVHRRIEDFRAAERTLPAAGNRLVLGPAGGAGLRRLVGGCETWMRGHRDWLLESQRRLGCHR